MRTHGVLLHEESLSPHSGALDACPDGPVLFLLDASRLMGMGATRRWVAFQVILVREVERGVGRPIEVRVGLPGEALGEFCRQWGLDTLHVDRTASPWLDDWRGAVGPSVTFEVHGPPPVERPPIRRLRFKPFWEAIRKDLP